MNLSKLALAATITTLASGVNAEMFFSDSSVSALYGESYKLGDDSDKGVVTFEHFSAHSWGDVFIFGDRLINKENEVKNRIFQKDGSETYIEVSPRFKVSGFDAGLIKNLYVATTWEMSEFTDDILVGLGTDFNIPGFQNLSLNAYNRFNDDGGNNYQTTVAWGVPFDIAGQGFKFDGFWDWATATDTTTNDYPNGRAATSNFTYQLKWDASSAIGTDNTVYIGIEHASWRNKFGVENGTFGLDTNEDAVSALVKVHF